MGDLLTLREGLWLDTGNQIESMRLLRSGWKATDSTGASYYQEHMKDGMLTAEEPTDGRQITVRVP
jgi:hypothetical protein